MHKYIFLARNFDWAYSSYLWKHNDTKHLQDNFQFSLLSEYIILKSQMQSRESYVRILINYSLTTQISLHTLPGEI